MSAVDDEVLARIALSRVAEPGDVMLGRWVAERGAVSAVDDLRRGRCPLRRGPAYLARFVGIKPEADLDRAAAIGARVVVPDTPGWPTQLDDLGDGRPLVLWLRGPAELRLAAVCSVAIVGSRASTAYGDSVAVDLAASLGEAGWTVVSGGAYGIDAAAHRGSLAVEATTVAVLANGIDELYPRTNDALLARIADTGLLLTELPPGEHPTRTRFLERNRIIAALTRGTVVIEGATRSGALGTAARAAAINRPVMGVPGPITSTTSAGVHALIRDGAATLVTGAQDVLEMVSSLTALRGDGAAPFPVQEEFRGPLDGLDPDLRSVHEALAARKPRSAAELATRAGVAEVSVLGLLGELGLRGLAERIDGGWRVAGHGR